LLRLRSLVFDVAMYALMAVMGVLLAPMAIWSVAGAHRACRIYSRTTLWLLHAICGLATEVRGPVPTGEVLIAAKHQSFLDILILVAHLPRPNFIMKQQLKWAPIFGLYAMRIGSTPVDRRAKSTAMRDMVARVGKAGTGPRQLVIYPQGTRVVPGAAPPYKIGAGVLYRRLGDVCVPAATNVGMFWARRSPYRRPGRAVLEFLDPIPPGLAIADFMARLEGVVEGRSNALMREAGFAGALPGPEAVATGAAGPERASPAAPVASGDQ